MQLVYTPSALARNRTRIIAVREIHFLPLGLAFFLGVFAASAAEPVTAAGPEHVVFPSLDGEVVAEERLAHGLLGRIRALALDPAERVHLANDYGEIWRLRPQESRQDHTLQENAK
jgi:hypothetical protein